MINGEQIERAERILQIIYRERDMPRQLQEAQVDVDAFGVFLHHRREVIKTHYRLAYNHADPRLHAAYATIIMHAFLVGLVCGRDEKELIV